MSTQANTAGRLLIIDDNRDIHADFRKVLAADENDDDLASMEKQLFGGSTKPSLRYQFELDSAYQGQDGLDLVKRAATEGRPYCVAFVDMRMPPGWDGLETIKRLWEVDAELQVVICTAYTDYSWTEIIETVGHSDRLLILKKPFDNMEVIQLAHALTDRHNAKANNGVPISDAKRVK